MLPALTSKPKQGAKQVVGLSNDSIDAYSNTPMNANGGASYADNTVTSSSNSPIKAAPPSGSKSNANGGGRTAIKKENEDASGSTTSATSGEYNGKPYVLARAIKDRKASGDEELTLTIGDVVRVVSNKRTGYLKCEFNDELGYVPASYLEFLDGENGGAGATGTDATGTTSVSQEANPNEASQAETAA